MQWVDGESAADSDTATHLAAPLPRTLRSFAFEERSAHPWDMPPGFRRVLSPRDGADASDFAYPPFGEMTFDREHAHGGQWSFAFTLAGGSMAAALAPEEAPAIPGIEARISGWVRTRDLHHARARVVAHYVDQAGRAIEGTDAASELIETRGEWRPIEFALAPAPREAASIIIELHLLQPEEFAPPASPYEPSFQDVSGNVWFDDFAVEHIPRLLLEVDHSDSAARDGGEDAEAALIVMVRDVANEITTVEMSIVDEAGAVVRRHVVENPPGRTVHRVPLEGLSCGWYRARVAVRSSSGEVLAESSLDVMVFAGAAAPVPTAAAAAARDG